MAGKDAAERAEAEAKQAGDRAAVEAEAIAATAEAETAAELRALEGALEADAPAGQPAPPVGQPAPAEPDQASTEDLAGMLQATSMLVAKVRSCDAWLLDEDAALELAGPLDRVLAKYLPDLEIGPEAALAVAVGGYVLHGVAAERAQLEAVDDDQAEPDLEPAIGVEPHGNLR